MMSEALLHTAVARLPRWETLPWLCRGSQDDKEELARKARAQTQVTVSATETEKRTDCTIPHRHGGHGRTRAVYSRMMYNMMWLALLRGGGGTRLAQRQTRTVSVRVYEDHPYKVSLAKPSNLEQDRLDVPR